MAEATVKRYKKHLEVKYDFNKGELEGMRSDVVEKLDQYDSKEEKMKTEAATYKSELKELETAVASLRKKIRSKYEMRSVECDVVEDKSDGTRIYFHPDTSRVLRTEKLNPSDLQLSIEDAY